MIIFDVDGVLADPSHRLHHIQGEKKDWEGFYKASLYDSVIRQGRIILQAVSAANRNHAFWTGRDEKYKNELWFWLKRHGLATTHFVRMRPHGDHCPDVELKARWVEEVGPENIDLVFEDRKRVVDMYRSYGITCYHTADGEF